MALIRARGCLVVWLLHLCSSLLASAIPPLQVLPLGESPQAVLTDSPRLPNVDYDQMQEAHDRRMHIKTGDTLSSVHHYELAVPSLVDDNGHFISYDVTDQFQVNMRRKRSINSPSDESIFLTNDTDTPPMDGNDDESGPMADTWIRYDIEAYGRRFQLALTPNKGLVAPRYMVEYWGSQGIDRQHRTLRTCHYHGYLRGDINSNVAISNCHGLHGVITAGDEDYFLEPLWNDTHHDRLTHGHLHVVYKRSAIKSIHSDPPCGVKDPSPKSSIPPWWLPSSQQQQQPSVMYNLVSGKGDHSEAAPPSVMSSPHSEAVKPGHRDKWERRKRRNRRHAHSDLNDTVTPYDFARRNDSITGVYANGTRRTRPRRWRRSVSVERHVEILVVVDKRMVAYHGKAHIEPYVLTVMNIVAKLYHDASIGNTINMVVTRLVLLTEDQENLSITHHADRSLESFCLWQRSINPTVPTERADAETTHAPGVEGVAHHDNAVLLTRLDICTYKNEPCGTLGLAPVAGMCEPDRSCSINEDIGLASAFTIAHEIGHNFGMQHDGTGNLCGRPGKEPAKIMAAQLTKDTEPFSWSSCSRDYITAFLDSGRGECLLNPPPEQDFDFPDEMPGQAHDADTQCQYQYGKRSRHCKAVELCRELWCINPSDKCVTNSIPAAEGTTCVFAENGTDTGWCYEGACVESGWQPRAVDGAWGAWSAWGRCTRTCGGGVEASVRQCNNPRPEHGGKYCNGERKGYRSCNIQDCEIDSTDFRQEQCSKYNDVQFRGKYYEWKTFSGEEEDIEAGQVKPCALNCLAVGFNFYTERAPKVIDGTRCYPDTKDICINGECKAVGCDGLLGSAAVEDRCRVCGGDGSMCDTVSGTFKKRFKNEGDAYKEVVLIPRGAVHISIEESIISRNYLALKSQKEDNFYINGDWTIDWPRKFEVANTIFNYERAKDKIEKLYALGPTTEDLVAMILLQEENLGISWRYNMLSNNLSHNATVFIWQATSWSECSKSCAKGVSTLRVVCVRQDDGSLVKDEYCAATSERPDDTSQPCNEQPCPPQWEIDEWGACSKTCDGGTRTRTVFCQQTIDSTTVEQVPARKCGKKRPRTRQKCHSKKCPPHWATDDWSECVSDCGPGTKTRNVYCVSAKGTQLPDTNCKNFPQPPATQKCMGTACPQPKWVAGKWGECSAKCGQGQQRRSVACRDHQDSASAKCSWLHKPHTVQICEGECRAEAENETVSSCEDVNILEYCELVRKFHYCNRAYFQQMCCKTCTLYGVSKRTR